jgi:hypothetical protein
MFFAGCPKDSSSGVDATTMSTDAPPTDGGSAPDAGVSGDQTGDGALPNAGDTATPASDVAGVKPGESAWTGVRQFGFEREPCAQLDLAVDSEGDVVIAGSGILQNSGSYVAKYNQRGELLWLPGLRASATSSTSIGAVAVDNGGNIVFAGATRAPFAGEMAYGGEDAFIGKLDQTGTRSWLHHFGTTGSDGFAAIAVDTAGNLFALGRSGAALPNAQGESVPGGVLAKFDPSGAALWAYGLGRSHDGPDMATDAAGNVYFIAGAGLAKFGSGGTKAWEVDIRTQPNTGDAVVDEFELLAIAVASDGSAIYLGGYDGGSGHSSITHGVIAKLGGTGLLQWAKRVNETSGMVTSVATSGDGSVVYVTGDDDAGLAKAYAANGARLWTQNGGQSTTPETPGGQAIALDSKGDVFVAGCTNRPFGTPGRGDPKLEDFFIAKIRGSDGRLY